MGARLTGTLVAANLLAVSGLAGLQLVGAVQQLEAKSVQGAAATLALQSAPETQPMVRSAVLSGRYPLHPVRILTRIDGDEVPERALMASLAVGDEITPTKVASPLERPAARLSSLGESEPAADMEAVAEDLGRITTAAGPAQALRSLAPASRPGPEEAWQAAPRRQVTARTSYRAKLVEAAPPSEPATEAATGSTPDGRARILARIVKAAAPEAVGYVVIGSYGTRDSADVEAQAFSQWHPEIMTAEVKGKTYFRVAVGPFARTDLSAALKAIVADGAKNAWPLVTKPRTQAAAPDKS